MFRETYFKKSDTSNYIGPIIARPNYTVVVPLVVAYPYIYENMSPRCVLISSLCALIQADLELFVPNTRY